VDLSNLELHALVTPMLAELLSREQMMDRLFLVFRS
jgi:hypothetical protein